QSAPHRLTEHAEVHVEADGVDEAGLLRSKEVAGAAQLEVLERDLVARPELGVVLEDRQPAVRILVDRVRHQQITAGPAVGPSNAAAQLIELSQAKCIGPGKEQPCGGTHTQ